ncbi:MAG: (d)CMP kinase [Crocinitomicaceae bacterium]|jgi:CMP/dCMP kinase|nr:(d)CMP kinase [Crocinitomicaceae bacterium]MDP4867053.1 (d)CMP kinase [Crocinitomicaceae bacterium]MDP5010293.1 (d)CMP kinase [Crocinitomicaceae bacterium]
MSFQKQLTIAIDGYSSCGKSTLAKAMANELNYTFVDSGAMYRGVALYCLRNGLIVNAIPNVSEIENHLPNIQLDFYYNPETRIQELLLNNENVEQEIRTPEVAAVVSQIATLRSVRVKLVEEQQKIGENGGIVMDGRDIGSVVFPDAEVKLFVTANPDVRAMRRFKELSEKGIITTFEDTKRNLLERDEIDSNRIESPLIQTADAIVLDNSQLTQEEQLQIALFHVQSKSRELAEKQLDC